MRGLTLGVAMLIPVAATAQPAAPTPGLPASPTHYLLQALLSLALVVALIYGAYWLLRRVGPGRVGAASSGPAELVQSVPLHGGYVLHVVRVRERLLAITCGPGGVATAEASAEAGEESE